MPSLPVELWIAVLDTLSTHSSDKSYSEYTLQRNTLYNICLVSRLFCALAQPLLFHDLRLARPAGTDKKEFRRRVRSLSTTLKEQYDLTQVVESISIVDENVGEDEMVFDPKVNGAVSRLLLRLDRLQNVTLQGVYITEEMHRHLDQLPYLKALELHNISGTPLPTTAPLDKEACRLTSLKITVSQNRTQRKKEARSYISGGLNIAVQFSLCPTLEELEVDLLTGLMLPRVLDDVAPPAFMYHSLRKLIFPPPSGPWVADWGFFPILERCPNVVDLDVDHGGCCELLPLEWAPHDTVLRALKHVKGCMEAIEGLVPGRPVETIVITKNGDDDTATKQITQEMLEPLTRGTVPVATLHFQDVQLDNELLQTIRSMFPNVHELQVDPAQDNLTPWIDDAPASSLMATPELEYAELSTEEDEECVEVGGPEPSGVIELEEDAKSGSSNRTSCLVGIHFEDADCGEMGMKTVTPPVVTHGFA